MANHINAVHQFKIAGLYRLPGAFKNLQVGMEYGLGNYANLKMPTTFSFGNGNPTTTNVIYSSNTLQANTIIKLELLQNFFIRPYFTAKAGIQTWYSNINIEDPADLDGCHPLEKKTILKDNSSTLGYGGGVMVDLSSFTKIARKGKHFLDFELISTKGGSLNYMNTRNLKDHHIATGNSGDGGKPLNMKFINITSNLIHEHQVAEVFTTPLRLLEFKISYTVKI
jgi:hypothetical protein